MEFKKEERFSPRNKKEKQLIQALTSTNTDSDTAALVRDLMTPVEIEEFANRLEAARLIKQGYPYQKVSQELGMSTTTVTRVAHWLLRGCGGYWNVLKQLKK
ncbi:MAG: YerC/YecD family TrpR-related protein [Candidatus Roizmanbacteria bacterium]|nr:YerC/YecD family TrpR-related protein [Candidatus Roizmanbacteria bacterium]